MRKQHGSIELIEVFAPDDIAAWSDIPPQHAGPTPPPVQTKSRRGAVVVGALVAIAFVAGAVALIDDNTSESAATTTLPVTVTTGRALLDPSVPTHFLLDDPALTPYSADVVTPPARGELVRVYTDGTAVGPVVTFELHPDTGARYGVVGATREVVDGYELTRLNIHCPQALTPVSERCKMLISERTVDDEWIVTVRATRLSSAEVSRIASSVRVIDGALAENSDLMEMLGLGLTFEHATLDDLIFGRVETAVRYLTADGEVVTLRSAVGGNPDRWSAGIRYLVSDAQWSFYGRTHGYLMDTGEAFVAWWEEGRRLSLVGPGDAGELAVLSRQVRPATDQEWTAMVYGLRPDYTLGDFETLATGRTSSSELWAAGPQITEREGRTEFLWWWTVPGRVNLTDSTPTSRGVGLWPHFDTLVVPGATFVFVSNPGRGGTVIVRTAAGVEYAADLARPFPAQSDVYMAVVRVEEPGPVTVEMDGVASP